MLSYKKHLKHPARNLRKNMTDSEIRLWSRLRRKQILGVQVYRQKPIGKYIVDFYVPKVKIVIEVDGSQHKINGNQDKDRDRDLFLEKRGILALRFNDNEVLINTDTVVESIYLVINQRLRTKSRFYQRGTCLFLLLIYNFEYMPFKEIIRGNYPSSLRKGGEQLPPFGKGYLGGL